MGSEKSRMNNVFCKLPSGKICLKWTDGKGGSGHWKFQMHFKFDFSAPTAAIIIFQDQTFDRNQNWLKIKTWNPIIFKRKVIQQINQSKHPMNT